MFGTIVCFWINLVSVLLAEENSILFEHHGVMLKHYGFLVLDANDEFLSLFVKVNIPSFPKVVLPDCAITEACKLNPKQQFCDPIRVLDFSSSVNNKVKLVTTEYIQLFEAIAGVSQANETVFRRPGSCIWCVEFCVYWH